jgi:hypothetical protein
MPEPARPPSSFVRIEKWLDQTELPVNDDPELLSSVVNKDAANNHHDNDNGNTIELVTKDEPSSNHYPTTSHLDLSQPSLASPQMKIYPDMSSQQQQQYQQQYQQQSQHYEQSPPTQHQYRDQQHLTSNYTSTKMEAPRPSMDRNRPSFDQSRSLHEGRSEYGTSPPNHHYLHLHSNNSNMQQPSPNPGMQLPVPPPPIQTSNLTVTGHGPTSPHSFHSSASQNSPISPNQLSHSQSPDRNILTPTPAAYIISPTTSGEGGLSYTNRTDRPSTAVHPTAMRKSHEPMHSMELHPISDSPRAGNHAPYIDYNNQPCAAGGIHDFAREWTFFDYLCVAICCPCYCSALCIKSILCSCTTESPQVASDKICGCGASVSDYKERIR